MPDADDTMEMSSSQERGSEDPLGIIGWEIAGKYKVRAYVGGGGFGEVYEGYNLNLPEQRLVLKFFKNVQVRERFDREAKILCLLDHPNISRVIDYLPREGALVIQYIDGRDCAELLRQSGRLDEQTFLKVAQAVSDAVAYAHQKNIAHRDLKPSNILVDKGGHVYLIDFGIAKEIGGTATRTGYQALTPMFAAPERQSGGKDYNPFASDIYELGVTLFNLATNTMPYRNPVAPNTSEWGGQAARQLSPELRAVLKKATHPDPAQRYQTAHEMAAELRSIKQAYARPGTTRWVVAALIVLAAAAGWWQREAIQGLLQGGANDARVAAQGAVATPPESPPPDTMAAAGETGGTAMDTSVVSPAQGEPPAAGEQPGSSPVETTPETTVASGQARVPPEEEPAVADTVVAQPPREEPPPPPPLPRFRLAVTPPGAEAVLVDGRTRPLGRAFEVSRGSHTVTVIHPDFPVLTRQVEATTGTYAVTIDLQDEFANADSVQLQVALVPPTEQHLLVFTLNGRERRYTTFPVVDLWSKEGEWRFAVDIQPVNSDNVSAPREDSCVYFPLGGGERRTVVGDSGTLTLAAGEQSKTVVVLVYWSQ